MGQPLPTPFAKPPGIGDSSPLVNFLWGLLNLVVGLVLLKVAPVSIGLHFGFLAFLLGVVALGAQLSRHFGAVRLGRQREG